MTRKFVTIFAAVAVASSCLMTMPAKAGGVLGDIVNGFVPGLGTAMDDVNREIKNRSSDASVYNQIMNAQLPNGSFQAAPGAGGPPPMPQAMPYCAFSDGQRFALPPAAVPNGAPCWHAFSNGVFNGQVVWN